MRPSSRSTAFAVARTNENPVGTKRFILDVTARRIAQIREMEPQFVLLKRKTLAPLNLHSQASKGHPVEAVLDQNTENQAPNDLIANFAFQAIHEDCATS